MRPYETSSVKQVVPPDSSAGISLVIVIQFIIVIAVMIFMQLTCSVRLKGVTPGS